MIIEIEWHVGTLRAWTSPDAKAGDPEYDWTCRVSRDAEDPTRVILGGTMTAPPLEVARGLAAALVGHGFTRMSIERRTKRRGRRWKHFDLIKLASR